MTESPTKKQKLVDGTSSCKDPESQALKGSSEQKGPQAGKFKIAVHVINALRRFGEAINPTYTYGKRETQEEPVLPSTQTKGFAPPRGSKSAFSSFMFPDNGNRASFNTRGHKGHLLFAPLKVPQEEVAQ